MSDMIFVYPEGRRLAQPAADEDHVGTVGPLRKHTAEIDRLLRRHIHELDADRLEQHGKFLRDTSTGDEYSVVKSFTDPVDPAANGVTAYTVREGFTCYLRPVGAVQKPDKVAELGELGGGRVA